MERKNPEKIVLPEPLKGRLYLTYAEFGSLVGVSAATVRHWVRCGYVKAREFSPRYRMIHLSELDRYKTGKLMERAGGNKEDQNANAECRY